MADLEVTGGGGEQGEYGIDAVLLAQYTCSDAKVQIRGIQRADKIAERLEHLQAKFADEPEKVAKFVSLRQNQQKRQEVRLQRIAEKASPGARDKARKALGDARGEDDGSDGDQGKGKSGSQDKGPTEDRGKGKEKG